MVILIKNMMFGGLLALLTGCASISALDGKVAGSLRDTAGDDRGVSEATLTDAANYMVPPIDPADTLEINSDTSLHVAIKHNRGFQDRRDALYRSVLALYQERRNRDPNFESSGQYASIVSGEESGDNTGNLDVSLSDTLYTGALLELRGISNVDDDDNVEEDTSGILYNTTASLRLEQPLLEGFGHTVSHNALIQAERTLLYDVRSFAQERQDFAIETLNRFYALVNQRSVLENTRLNVEQSIFLLRRSEAMFKVQMAPYIDVLRSQQQELSAQTRLASVEASYATAKRRFLSRLGMPVSTQLVVQDDIPPLQRLVADREACILTALANRVDLKNTLGQVEDARRTLKVARNALWPQVNAFGQVRYESDKDKKVLGDDFEEEVTVGISFDIPLDLREERDALKSAELTLAASRRALVQQEENIQIEVLENFNNLENFKRNVDIEKQNNIIADKRVRNAELRFKAGELSNRDVVEAQDEQLNTRNALVQALINHEIERLRLMRNLGIMDIGVEGDLQVLEDAQDKQGALFAAPEEVTITKSHVEK